MGTGVLSITRVKMEWYFKPSIQLPKGQLDFVEKWPLMNANDLAFLLISYLVFVLIVGPMLMEKRPPIQIKRLMVPYNVVKICNSGVLAWRCFCYLADKGWFPEACDHDEATHYVIAALYYRYLCTKLLDLLDTVIFVLRKKNNQMTFLHVYHHVFMVVSSWTTLKYDPSDHWGFTAFLNCLVHIVMYTYYCGSAMGPTFAKYLWWKKYLTMMQLVQFVLVMGHMVIQTSSTRCPIHPITYWMGLSNTAFFLCLFADFYVRRYKAPCNKKSSVYLECMKSNIE